MALSIIFVAVGILECWILFVFFLLYIYFCGWFIDSEGAPNSNTGEVESGAIFMELMMKLNHWQMKFAGTEIIRIASQFLSGIVRRVERGSYDLVKWQKYAETWGQTSIQELESTPMQKGGWITRRLIRIGSRWGRTSETPTYSKHSVRRRSPLSARFPCTFYQAPAATIPPLFVFQGIPPFLIVRHSHGRGLFSRRHFAFSRKTLGEHFCLALCSPDGQSRRNTFENEVLRSVLYSSVRNSRKFCRRLKKWSYSCIRLR